MPYNSHLAGVRPLPHSFTNLRFAMSDTRSSSPETLRGLVREKYAAVARTGKITGCACGCAPDELSMIGDAYEGTAGHVAAADLGLGCGLPVEHARLADGDTVLDLGAGAGIDAFVARHQVGPTGRVIGLDFTPEMVAKARQNALSLGYANVEFIEGDIEMMPLSDDSVDVVISNCVLNLVPDKQRAFSEMYRVLRPGGHFCISDIVADGRLPQELLQIAELYAGCVSGAMQRRDYLELLTASGFEEVEVVQQHPIELPDAILANLSEDSRSLLHAGGVVSITVTGSKPDAG
jgi:arsenite methyltransferase